MTTTGEGTGASAGADPIAEVFNKIRAHVTEIESALGVGRGVALGFEMTSAHSLAASAGKMLTQAWEGGSAEIDALRDTINALWRAVTLGRFVADAVYEKLAPRQKRAIQQIEAVAMFFLEEDKPDGTPTVWVERLGSHDADPSVACLALHFRDESTTVHVGDLGDCELDSQGPAFGELWMHLTGIPTTLRDLGD